MATIYDIGEARSRPLRLSPELIAKLRVELNRLALSTKPAVQRFVRQMRARYPDLLSEKEQSTRA